MTAAERFEEASRQFMLALEDAWKPTDVQEQGTLSYHALVQALGEASISITQQRVSQAYVPYMVVIQDALRRGDIPKRSAEAFAAYIGSVRNALAELDVNSVGPSDLATIGQSMLDTSLIAGIASGAAELVGMPPSTAMTGLPASGAAGLFGVSGSTSLASPRDDGS